MVTNPSSDPNDQHSKPENAWLNNVDTVNSVKRLLTTMGMPLETRVARICEDSERWFQHIGYSTNASFSNSRLVYGNSMDTTALREVDRVLNISMDVMIGSEFDTWLNCSVLIECKHRTGIGMFGFPYSTAHSAMPINPILTSFAFADWFQQLQSAVPFLSGEPLCTIGMIQLSGAHSVSKEELAYNAAGSLYDYIRWHGSPLSDAAVDPIVVELGLLDTFKSAYTTPPDDWWATARRWIRAEATPDMYQTYNTKREAQRGSSLPPVWVHVPIVCVDAPLYVVQLTDAGEIAGIEPTDFLYVSNRLPRWPGPLQAYLVHPTPEALVTVVNVDYLSNFLDRLAPWFGSIQSHLATMDEDVGNTLPLQMAFLQSVASTIAKPYPEENLWHV